MKDRPLVSVVIPAYNAERYLATALASVQAQTYENLEIFVIDDGSKDRTHEIAERAAKNDPRITVLHQPNLGVAAARNLGIAHSRGEYIAPLDADDVWYPEKIEKQLARMNPVDPSVGLVYGWNVHIDEEGKLLKDHERWTLEGFVHDALTLRNFVGSASVPLMKRACLDRVGAYSPSFRERGAEGCEDWDLYLRLAEVYRFRVVPKHLVGYRIHRGNMSANYRSMSSSKKLVIEGIQSRGRSVPRRVLRWSRSRRTILQLMSEYSNRSYLTAFTLALEGLRVDPWGLAAFMYEILLARFDADARKRKHSPPLPRWSFNPYGALERRRWEWVTRYCQARNSLLESRTPDRALLRDEA